MKNCILTLLILVISHMSYSQSNNDYESNSEQNQEEGESSNQDSLRNANIKNVRLKWIWQHDGVYKKFVETDTSFDNYHYYNYIFRQNVSNTYLGNNPSPYESNVFINRENGEEFFYLNNIRAYIVKPLDIPLYNTTTPFTQLRYINSGSRGFGEQHFDGFHSQNIKPEWNAGFRYNLTKGDGRYISQSASAYNFSIFSNYEKRRNIVSFFLNQNIGKFEENGGIKERGFVTDSTEYEAENIAVNLNGQGVKNKLRNLNFKLEAQHNIGKARLQISKIDTLKRESSNTKFDTLLNAGIDSLNQLHSSMLIQPYADSLALDTINIDLSLQAIIDSIMSCSSHSDSVIQYQIDSLTLLLTDSIIYDTIFSYPLKAVFGVNIEGNERKYYEESINHDFFKNTYIDSTAFRERMLNKNYDVSAKVVLNNHPKFPYFPQAFAGINYVKSDYNQRIGFDTITKKQSFGKQSFNTVYLSAGIFNVDTNTVINYDLNAKIAVVGDYIGDFEINGLVKKSLKKDWSSYLEASANISLKHPNPFYNRYIGNHNIWNNDFTAIKNIDIRGKYINKNINTELGVGINNMFNHIYFDSLARPHQTDKALLIFTAWAKKTFKLGNFYFDQKAYFQINTQDDIVPLPMFSVYSHNYYKNHIFKKALGVAIGFDFLYNTKFYANNYMPSTMTFYQQRKYKTGNYPKFDVFLNIEIQRAVIFARYEHLNYVLSKAGNYFSAADYPMNPAMFEYGIRWNFFD